MREICLDTETTGLDPADGHRVIEIGCVEMVGRVRTGRFFHSYLNPERDIPPEAFRIHGLSAEFLAGKPFFFEVARDMMDFIGGSPLVIHNAEFDLKFLNAELAGAGLPAFGPEKAIVDTVLLARRKFPGAPANLEALCKRFNIDLSARTKHGALLDAELLAEVYLELTGGRQDSMRLEAAAASPAHTGAQAATHPSRSFPPSAAELAAHAEFLQRIKQALWLQKNAA